MASLFSMAVALLCAVTAFISAVCALNVEVPMHDQACFFEDFSAGENGTISYQVSEGDLLQVGFWVANPRQATIYTSEEKQTGDYHLHVIETGRYTFCFSNKRQSTGPRLVQFSIDKVGLPPISLVKDGLEPVHAAVRELDYDIHIMKTETEYLLQRGEVHQMIAESSRRRILWWAIIQAAMVIGVCAFQIRYLLHTIKSRQGF